jgi:signal transduction histidine kinase
MDTMEAAREPADSGRRASRARFTWTLVACCSFLAVYVSWQWLRWGGASSKVLIGDLFFVPLNALATATAWMAARRCARRPRLRRCWRLIATALFVYLLGDVVQTYNEAVAHIRPFPSLGDTAYLAFYPLMLAALVSFPSPRRDRRQRWTLLLDYALVSLSGAVPIWYLSLGPTIVNGGQTALAMADSVAYPIGDMVLLAGLAALLLRPVSDGSRAALTLLGAGLLGFVVTDLIYGWIALHSSYAGGDLVDSGWVVSLVFFAAAGAKQPQLAVALATGAVESYRRRISWLPYVGLAGTLGLAAVIEWHERNVLVLVIFGAGALLAVLVSVRQLVVQAELLDVQHQLRAAQTERAALLDRTLRHGEEERIRIASELHDGPVQRLAALGYLLDRASRMGSRGDAGRTVELLDEALVELRREIGGLRRLMSDLRPPVLDESGLYNALRDLVAHLFGDTTVDAQVMGESGVERLPPETETVLYRVAQEALLNVARHAEAHCVRVQLVPGTNSLTLLVKDDGVGFSPAVARARRLEGHFGLIGMRERIELEGGLWSLESTPGAGTRISVTVAWPGAVPPSQQAIRVRSQAVPA